MEADWKKFRDMVPMLRERYLSERNVLVSRILIDPEKTETERFWDALEAMEKEAEVLRRCLDGHSRSKMWLYILTMIGAGMLRKEDMEEFSSELQQEVAYAFDKRKD